MVAIRTSSTMAFANAKIATGFLGRAKGLLGRSSMAEDEALVFLKCNSVHTIGMKFAIDVIFLDRENTVLKIANSVKPFKFPLCLKAKTVVEARSGACIDKGIKVNDVLYFEN